MSLFSAEAAPRVFAVLPGSDYAAALTEGLYARLGPTAPPEAAARVSILVNTARASRAIEAAMAARARAATGGGLLPAIRLVTALWEDPLALPELPPAIDRLRRRLRLTRLVESFLAAAPGRAPVAAAPELAESLARLIDELDEWGVEAARLDGLVEGEMARHWQEALAFADIVRAHWPEIRAEAEGGALDPAARARRTVEALTAAWRENPPEAPTIVAGSTGSRAPTAELMAAIAHLPQGAVVLPGFDPAIEPEVWERIGPDHPFGPFRRLLDRLDMRPGDVRLWIEEARAPRLGLLAQALRPAPVTDAWVAARDRLAADAPPATEGLSLVEAASPTEEAAAIALAIRREIATPGRRAALVTRDATLARRVTAELSRFGILPDDSLGRPLADSAAGVFLRLIAELAGAAADPIRLAALFNHPLTSPGLPRGPHLRLARAYELAVLRRVPDPSLPPGRLADWPAGDDCRGAPPEGFSAWKSAIEAALAPLAAALASGASLAETVACHRRAAEALSSPEGQPRCWNEPDGEAARALFDRIEAAADAYGEGGELRYATLLVTLMRDETLRPDAARAHPRAIIWGTREARVEAAELTILGGLNEGSWPPASPADPWLSRPMRAALGLPSPERQIGLSAHDFLQAAARPRVILTRARKVGGAPAVASRWLVRLENLLGGTAPDALEAMKARGREILGLVPLIHRPAPEEALAPATRPRPRPPVAARPRRLSVTRIETLIRDAYAVYAEKILRLSPLDPLGKPPDALERGTVIHAILHHFVAETPAAETPEAARTRLLALAEAELAARIPWPETRRAWAGRIARAADWFLQGEAERRARGEPVALECPGEMLLDLPAGPFRLTATADRIDRVGEGAMIYDYKAGDPPSARQIGFFNQQLHLQALILEAGGFEGLAPMRAIGGAYLGFSGSDKGGKEVAPNDDHAIPATLPQHREKLIRLLSSYDSETRAYVSRGMAERDGFEGSYDHLARRGEWEAAEADGPEDAA